jgi:hypothetical protein
MDADHRAATIGRRGDASFRQISKDKLSPNITGLTINFAAPFIRST